MKEPKATKPVSRPKRVPIHQRSNMPIYSRPGYEARIVNDVPGRIEAFKEAGWTLVKKDAEDASLRKIEDSSSLDGAVSFTVNRDKDANTHRGYLMELPIELRQEDEAAKQRRVDATERRMDPKTAGADYGSVDYKNINKR